MLSYSDKEVMEMLFKSPDNGSKRPFAVAVILIMVMAALISVNISTDSLRLIETEVSNNTAYHRVDNITSIGDLDNDGFIDIALLIPLNSSFEADGGTAHIFLGTEEGYPAISPENADVSFYGGPGFELGSSMDVWDIDGNGWGEVVLGCPGANGSAGRVLMFDSVLVNGAPKGTFIPSNQAYVILERASKFRFGEHISVSEYNGDQYEDLVVISGKNDTLDPELAIYPGGSAPGTGDHLTLDALSVSPLTSHCSVDLIGKGRDAFVYSTPDKGETRITYIDPGPALDTKKITGLNGIGTSLSAFDVNGDMEEDLLVGNPKQNDVSIFFGNETYWESLGGMNYDIRNITLTGPPSSLFGTAMTVLGPSDFTPDNGLMVSAPGNDEGSVFRFDLPFLLSQYDWDEHSMETIAPAGADLFGMHLLAIGDPKDTGYPGILISARSDNNRLVIHEYDRSPNPPKLSLDAPSRENPLAGVVKIKASTSDLDGDVSPWDIKFFYSVDNRSWATVGNGIPDEVISNQAIKNWNTSVLENRYFFLMVQVNDSYGNTVRRYSNSVEVFNHEEPTTILIYPTDGTLLKGNEEITARVIVAEKEEIDYPIDFLYSRDGENWINFGNTSTPISGSDVDYSFTIDTETIPDGDIWFKVNATTVYGLGREDSNSEPCVLDNAYAPVVEFTGNYTGAARNIVNFTLRARDRDDDLQQPLELYYRVLDTIPWEFMGNMSGPLENDTFYFEWDTTSVENDIYQVKVFATDSTNKEAEVILNVTIDVHNLYTPSVDFIDIDEDSVFSGIPRLTAVITDRDRNFNNSNVSFFYRDPDVGFWNRITPVLVKGTSAIADWDTTSVENGDYDLRVEVIDRDGLVGSHEIFGVTVKNVKPPIVEGELIPTIGSLSGVVRLRFNVSDDQEVPMRNILVEIFVFSEWVEIEGVEKADPNQTFEPWKNISYHIDWNTATLSPTGERVFPDGPVYEYKFTVTDQDGEPDSWRSVVTYTVKNAGTNNGGDPEEEEEEEGGLSTGALAIIIFASIILLVIILIVLFIFLGSRKEKEGTLPPIEIPKPKPRVEVIEPQEQRPERSDDIYTPSERETRPSAPEPEEPEPGLDDSFLSYASEAGPDLEGPDAEIYSAEGPTLIDDMFMETVPAPERKKKAPRKKEDERIDIDLPEGAMPDTSEEWEDVDEWDDVEEDEEEWEELDEFDDEEDWDDLEEEEGEWEELEDDEEEWESEDEDYEEEVFVVTCKCGEEIEIPTSFKGSKFRCPSCKRTGKLRK